MDMVDVTFLLSSTQKSASAPSTRKGDLKSRYMMSSIQPRLKKKKHRVSLGKLLRANTGRVDRPLQLPPP